MYAIFSQLLENVPLNVRVDMQHDGVPTHDAMCSRLVINHMFLRRWIEREETINYSLTWSKVARFLPRGFIKDWVMLTAPTTTEGVKNRIRRACAEVTPEMLACVRECICQSILKCILIEGHHFKHE